MYVAAACFARLGYQQTTMADICKEAGVATATLYRHFGSKEALFEAVGRPAPQEPEGDPYRRRILDAALTLFSCGGYQATTLTEIAEAAGVARTTLYAQFPTKEAILMGVMRENTAMAFAARTGGEAAAAPGAGAGRHAAIEALALQIICQEQDPRRLALVRLLVAEGVRFPELQHSYHQGETAVYERLSGFFRRLWPDLADPLFAARFFLGALLSFVRQEIVPGSSLPRYSDTEIAHRVATAVIHGIEGGETSCR